MCFCFVFDHAFKAAINKNMEVHLSCWTEAFVYLKYLAASRGRHLAIGFRGLGNRACYAWLDAGWMLAGCSLDADLMLAGCWFDAGWMLAGCWLDAGWMLA
jgi:hypothetical protein